MKKKLVALLVATMVSFTLAGCGEDYEETTSAPVVQETVQETVQEATQETVADAGDAVAQQEAWIEEQMAVIISYKEEYYAIVKSGVEGEEQALYEALCALSVKTTEEAEALKAAAYYEENLTLAQLISDASIDLNDAVLKHAEALAQNDASILDQVEECLTNYMSEMDAALTAIGA